MNNDNFNDNNIICGRNPVLEALRSGAPLDAVYICGNGGILGKIRAMARNSGAVVKKPSTPESSTSLQAANPIRA